MTADDMKVVQQCLDVVNNGENIKSNPRDGGYEVHCNGKLAFWFSIDHCISNLSKCVIWVDGKKMPTIYEQNVYVKPKSLLGLLYWRCSHIYEEQVKADPVKAFSYLEQFKKR